MHRRSRRQAVVNKDHRATANGWRVSGAPVFAIAPVQLQSLAHGHLLNDRLRYAEVADHILAQYLDSPRSDRAHCELRMARHAKLANEEDIKRDEQFRRDFVPDGYAAARQCQENDVGSTCVLAQVGREMAPGVGAIQKPHRQIEAAEGTKTIVRLTSPL
jgi:hypothetical protein